MTTWPDEEHMAKKSLGAKVWFIPDSYLPDQSTGGMKSHESVCVLNLNRRPAKVKITVYFEDREPLTGLEAECPAQRTAHVHLESLKNRAGEMVPIAKPMALMVESNVEVVGGQGGPAPDFSFAELYRLVFMAGRNWVAPRTGGRVIGPAEKIAWQELIESFWPQDGK